jgi:ABC-type nitrate/sulfonate/bicarbonate transport system substrate-binding protein
VRCSCTSSIADRASRVDRAVRVACLALALAITLAALTAREAHAAPAEVSPARSPARAHDSVRVLLPDGDNLQYLSFWVAKGAGYFGDEGMDLEILTPSSPPGTMAMVQTGAYDVFVLPPPVYLTLMEQRYPLLLVANLLQNDPINVIVRRSVMEARKLSASAPLVERLKGMHGLKVGVAPGPPTRLRALFASQGLDADREIEIVIVHGRDQNAAFAAGTVDALYCHTPYLETALVDQDAVMLVHQSGGEVKELAARQIHALVVSQALAKSNPERVFAMTRAIYRAERTVHDDRAASVRAVLHEFPSMDPRKVETIVRLYEPAVPATPRVSVQGIDPALVLFPASRAAPDLHKIDVHDYVAPAFADRAVEDAENAKREGERRVANVTESAPSSLARSRTTIAVSVAALVAALVAFAIARARVKARQTRDERANGRTGKRTDK